MCPLNVLLAMTIFSKFSIELGLGEGELGTVEPHTGTGEVFLDLQEA